MLRRKKQSARRMVFIHRVVGFYRVLYCKAAMAAAAALPGCGAGLRQF
jgi:hypothetical protein